MPSSPKRPCSTGKTTSTDAERLRARRPARRRPARCAVGSAGQHDRGARRSTSGSVASGDLQLRRVGASVSTQPPLARDADRHDLVPVRVERREHAARRDHRDAVLAAASAVDDGDPDLAASFRPCGRPYRSALDARSYSSRSRSWSTATSALAPCAPGLEPAGSRPPRRPAVIGTSTPWRCGEVEHRPAGLDALGHLAVRGLPAPARASRRGRAARRRSGCATAARCRSRPGRRGRPGPAKVIGSAPRAAPSRAVSASPRVMSDARVLSPKPMPCAMPHASAMTFLTAPPSSHPTTSVLVYGRKYGVAQACWTHDRPVAGRRRRRRWPSAARCGDLAGEVRAGDHGDAVRRRAGDLGDHLAHPLRRAELDALHQADERRVLGRGTAPSSRGSRAASATGWRSRRGPRRRSAAAWSWVAVQRGRQLEAGQVVGVLVRPR